MYFVYIDINKITYIINININGMVSNQSKYFKCFHSYYCFAFFQLIFSVIIFIVIYRYALQSK